MKPLTKKTTKAHFEKYADMKKVLGVSFKDSTAFGSREKLVILFQEDPALNQIDLTRFDRYHFTYNNLHKRFSPLADRSGLSYSDVTCLIKHCLVYEVIGVTPVFEE